MAFYLACLNGHFASAMTLINEGVAEFGENPIAQATAQRYSALVQAFNFGCSAPAMALLKKWHDIDVNYKWNGADENTLLICACHKCPIDVVMSLIDRGANLNDTGRLGYTALLRACSDRNSEAAMVLIDCGADQNVKDYLGLTALDITLRKSLTDVSTVLIMNQAEFNHGAMDDETREEYERARTAALNLTCKNPMGTDEDEDG